MICGSVQSQIDVEELLASKAVHWNAVVSIEGMEGRQTKGKLVSCPLYLEFTTKTTRVLSSSCTKMKMIGLYVLFTFVDGKRGAHERVHAPTRTRTTGLCAPTSPTLSIRFASESEFESTFSHLHAIYCICQS